MDNTLIGIKIVGGLANIAADVGQKISLEELCTILSILGHQTSTGEEYVQPGKLVGEAIKKYTDDGNSTTANNIKTVFNRPECR
ncbi:MAG: hypothetical protein LBQ57_12375 [Spirochaetales bacterium]|nr:hypothetical protein [Spirochaetales bacterium]